MARIPSPAVIKKVQTAKTAVEKLSTAWMAYADKYGYPNGSVTGTPAYVRVLPKNMARMNFQVFPEDMERILAWFKACGLRPEFRWSTGTLTITEETTMDTKDPLIEAAVEYLKEDQSRAFSYVVRECVKLAHPLVPMEQIQVAAAIISQTKRQLRPGGGSWADADDAAVAQKLEVIERQLDNLANSL